MAKRTKWLVFQPQASIASTGATESGWIEQQITVSGTIKSIRGTCIDPTTQASAQQELEKVVLMKWELKEEQRTSDIYLPIAQVAGIGGFPVAVGERVQNGDKLRVNFKNPATAGNALLPTVSFELEVDG